MAALKNNGTEVARVVTTRDVGCGGTHDVQFSLRSNGRILVNYGKKWTMLDGYSRNRPASDWGPTLRLLRVLTERRARIVAGKMPDNYGAWGDSLQAHAAREEAHRLKTDGGTR